MEHKIGEIITLPDGRKAEVVETPEDNCGKCLFARAEEVLDCMDICDLDCAALHRTDRKNIIYKEIKD